MVWIGNDVHSPDHSLPSSSICPSAMCEHVESPGWCGETTSMVWAPPGPGALGCLFGNQASIPVLVVCPDAKTLCCYRI